MKLSASPSTPDMLAMSEEEQVFLSALCEELTTMLEDAERAMAEKFDAQMFDVDEASALWSLLPSKVRTAIKRGGSKPTSACPECHAIGTHTRHCSTGGRFA
jgi:hypothetical protein